MPFYQEPFFLGLPSCDRYKGWRSRGHFAKETEAARKGARNGGRFFASFLIESFFHASGASSSSNLFVKQDF